MHELIACTASVIILTLFIAQTAANTNTFIEAAYCERVISEHTSIAYEKDDIDRGLDELKAELEKMPGVRADIRGDTLDVYLDGIVGPAGILGTGDNSIHLEKKLKLDIAEGEDEKPDSYDRYTDDTIASEQDTDGDESSDPLIDMNY